MQNEELFEEIDNTLSVTEKHFGISLGKFLLLVILVLGLGIYIGILLFGDNSVNILLGLEDYHSYLQNEIIRLKSENADLQKEYFELKEISAQ